MNFESPIFVNIVLGTLYVLLAVAVVATAWSTFRGMRMQEPSERMQHGIPTRRIAWLTAAALLVVMLLAWLLGSTKAIYVNGKEYADAFWLRISDMFIYSVAALLVAAGVCVAVSQIAGRWNSKR